jgi:hypothetical protein
MGVAEGSGGVAVAGREVRVGAAVRGSGEGFKVGKAGCEVAVDGFIATAPVAIPIRGSVGASLVVIAPKFCARNGPAKARATITITATPTSPSKQAPILESDLLACRDGVGGTVTVRTPENNTPQCGQRVASWLTGRPHLPQVNDLYIGYLPGKRNSR